jgi:homoserine dehydrogenase
MKPIQVGLLGIGTVGSGTFNVLKRNQEEIRAPCRARHRHGHGGRPRRGARAKSRWWATMAQVVNDARAVIANPRSTSWLS